MTAAPGQRPDEPTDFRAAIAQWRLALRTEVKRCSSLPSSMFDACDPALETHLASTAEAMLMALLASPSPAADGEPPGRPSHLQPRHERIGSAELRRLPNLVGKGVPTHASLDAGLDEEFLAILSEIVCADAGPHVERAIDLLQQQFGEVAEFAQSVRQRTPPTPDRSTA
jgi:hypothetical protein